MAAQTPGSLRWTAKRKTAVVLNGLKGLKGLKGQTTSVDAFRNYGIQQSDPEEWTQRFLKAGEHGLRVNPPDEFARYKTKINTR